jgi:hypothetical protein
MFYHYSKKIHKIHIREAGLELPSEDITRQLINRTIYTEYLYPGWRGYWLAPAPNYRAAVWPVIEEQIFDPLQGIRILVVDCGDGFVCLRTRWKEEEYPNYFLESARHYFKYSTYPADNEKMKWKVYCQSANSTERCILCDKYYSAEYESKNCMYVRNEGYTESADVKDTPASWFLLRLVVPRAEVKGYEDLSSAQSVCNEGGQSAVFEVQNCEGTTTAQEASWHISHSVTTEVSGAFQLELLKVGTIVRHNTLWGKAFSNKNTFTRETCAKLVVTVPARKRAGITHLYGTYGPYIVRTSVYHIEEEDCVEGVAEPLRSTSGSVWSSSKLSYLLLAIYIYKF